MEIDINEIYSKINGIVEKNKECREQSNFLGLLENCEECLELIYPLINYCQQQECEYRAIIASKVGQIDERNRKLITYSQAEIIAKATPFYSTWKRSQMVIDYLYEVIKVAKKFASEIDRDKRNYRAEMG